MSTPRPTSAKEDIKKAYAQFSVERESKGKVCTVTIRCKRHMLGEEARPDRQNGGLRNINDCDTER